MKTFFKYSLFLLCAAFFWGKTDKAMATCGLTSSVASVTVNQNYTFAKNSNGTGSNETPQKDTFWNGTTSEKYSCPVDTLEFLGFCGTDAQYLVGGKNTSLGPGITGGAYAAYGSGTTGAYGGCFAVGWAGPHPGSGNMPTELTGWKYAGVTLKISDSTQARNITLNNKLVGYIYLASSNYDGKTIGGSPLTKVYVSGTVTIPASCTLASGSTIELPDTFSGEYSKAGTGGKVGTGTTQPMSIKCLGGSESATLNLYVSTTKTSGDDIVTSNPDVGVRVDDGNGKAVSVNTSILTATLNGGEVDVPFTYTPVAITGKNPTPGDYSAIETITVTLP
ncbi:fimbrial protein [Enterobacter soli]|uniref:fimbrial protein n=1 Tax=Enterobacter soli TaxID=885040 RepID=UPI0034CFD56A